MFGRRPAREKNRSDFAQEGECAAAVLAAEGLWFGKFGDGFALGSEEESDAQTGLFGSGTQEAVVPDTGKTFG